MSPGKPITPEGLARDLEYVLEGTIYHEAFYEVCPPRPGLTVLEPGCNSGKFGSAYWIKGAAVTLLDIDPGVLQYTARLVQHVAKVYAKREADYLIGGELTPTLIDFTLEIMIVQRPTLRLLLGSIHELTTLWPEPMFDLCLNEGVPHHWPRGDPRRQGAIDQMAAVTKPGGKVALMVSSAHCPEMMRYADTVKHTYAGMPEVQTPFSQDELEEALVLAGLQDVGVRPVESVVLERARTLLGYGTKG